MTTHALPTAWATAGPLGPVDGPPPPLPSATSTSTTRASGTGPSPRRGVAATRSLLCAWREGWCAVVLHCLHLFTAVAAWCVLGLAIAGLFSLPAVGVGLLLLIPGLWGAWLLGRAERHLLAAFTGTDIGEPLPSQASGFRRAVGFDLPRLRSLGWSGLHALWGIFAGAVVLSVLGQAVMLAAMPLYAFAIPDAGLQVLAFLRLDGPLSQTTGWLVGLVLLLVVPWLARGLATVDLALGRWLLGADPQRQLREMSRRVETLTTTRTEAVDSVEAERRRIERDLHDGPQQRLVSIAMSLGLAKESIEHDPAAAKALLDEAHASSKEAITEMRQVARGIVPPILTDRGLDAAVSALAARSPVPVSVSSRVPVRLDPTVEAIAYFCVSEALTNVAKHAGATRAAVDLGVARTLEGDRLAVTVSDDGRGGAIVGGGTGLTGLRQRVAAVDGDLHVHSPVGGGTTLALTLPMRAEVQR